MIVEYEQIRLDLAAMEKPIDELSLALDIEGAQEAVKKLEQETLAPDFYNDIKKWRLRDGTQMRKMQRDNKN